MKREHYPDHEAELLSGHTITLVSPLNICSLLPVDIEFTIENQHDRQCRSIPAGGELMLTSVRYFVSDILSLLFTD